MNQELIENLKKITAEEQELLNGRKGIDTAIYMQGNSREADSNLLLGKGKLISLRPHTRFVHFPRHTHNFVEMIYMCQGSTHHRINDRDIVLKQGELLILNQNATQEIFPAGEEDIAVNFIILPQFFDTAIRMIGEEENLIRNFLVDCLRGKNSDMGYLHFEVSDVLPIQNLLENLIWTLENPQPNKRSIHQYTMGLLFLQLINYTEKLRTDPKDSQKALMASVLRYIEEHYRDGELRGLAEELHYDTYWLSREIKKQSGKNFTELLQIKRLNQAAFLLKTTTLKITDISANVGYENLSYFHRIFFRYYGISPKKYRVANQDTFSVN